MLLLFVEWKVATESIAVAAVPVMLSGGKWMEGKTLFVRDSCSYVTHSRCPYAARICFSHIKEKSSFDAEMPC